MNANRAGRLTVTWVAGIIIALGMLYAVMLAVSGRRLRAVCETLEQAGRPMKAEAIIPPPVPDADNAALLYQSAVKLLKAEPGDSGAPGDLFERLSDLASDCLGAPATNETADILWGLLQGDVAGQALALIEKAATRPACRYELDYSAGPGMLLPHLTDMRAVSRLIAAKARLQAAHDDVGGAWDTMVLGLKVADALRDEPILISQLVRIGQATLTFEALGDLCAAHVPDAAHAQRLDTLLSAFDDTAPFIRSLDGERLLLGEWVFRMDGTSLAGMMWSEGAAPSTGRLALSAVTFLKPLLQLDHACYLRLMAEQTEAAVDPRAACGKGTADDLAARIPRYCIFTQLILPALGAAGTRNAEFIAAARVARTGLALRRYRAANGAWPDTLEAPGMPKLVDPLTGEALRYRKDGDNVVLYSVGRDGHDDGGKSTKPAPDGPVGDWCVWRLGAAAAE